MDVREYRDALRSVLESTEAETLRRLGLISRAAAEADIEEIVLDLFVDDDAEGPFDVWARFEGESVFVTQQRLGDERQLVDVVWTESGWEPPVPDRPSGWTRADLQEALVDVVAEWLTALLPTGAADRVWVLQTPDGEIDPRELRRPGRT
ncbi:DUF6389 family protein [Microbacterium sp. TNHR37B]|uniref:DUF6389 family protein n=1 Tax=Microbacterium sp. TNHR37B TaxID=1775956 RepID=UPI0007B24F09|nr:DUF6389 family protein [Microbacterium sp. TNHR37B]KZE89500.1 hypothetical protein AVP41_02298 [Microbacterium sp. TNHR37B]